MSGIGSVTGYLAPNHGATVPSAQPEAAAAKDGEAPPAGILPNAPDRLTISSAAPPLSVDMVAQLLNAQAESNGA